MPEKITEFVNENGSWRALYIDDELAFEGEKLTMSQLCEELDVEYTVKVRPNSFFDNTPETI